MWPTDDLFEAASTAPSGAEGTPMMRDVGSGTT
jgi:hypothetical protein